MFSGIKESIAAAALLGTLFGTAAAQPLAERTPEAEDDCHKTVILPPDLSGDDFKTACKLAGFTFQTHIELFEKVLDLSQERSVRPVSVDKMMEGALRGALRAIDPHSSYLNAEEYSEMLAESTGQFGGIGLEVVKKDDNLAVVSTTDGAPAKRAGIKPGDIIVSIGNMPTLDMGLGEAIQKLRGNPGTTLRLAIKRENIPDLITMELTREVIKITSLKTVKIGDDIGYVRLYSFDTKNTAALTGAALEELKGRKIILDLRDNPGGYLVQSIRVADLFLDSTDVIVTVKGPLHDPQIYRARPGDLTQGADVVVLVDSGSASASEVLSAALQDNDRARILGTQTFGKGSVQTVLPLKDILPGRKDAVRITTDLYYTPRGRSIQARGIEPDIAFESAAAKSDNRRITEAALKGTIANPDQITETDARRTQETCASAGSDASNLDKSLLDSDGQPDYQLICAVEYLRGKHSLTRITPVAQQRPADAPRQTPDR